MNADQHNGGSGEEALGRHPLDISACRPHLFLSLSIFYLSALYLCLFAELSYHLLSAFIHSVRLRCDWS